MMKHTKKVLAEILLVCMMISSVFPAYAVEASEIPEQTEVVEVTPEAVPEAEEVPAEPVEAAGADGDFVCAEIIEAAEAVEAEETDEVSGDAAESIGTEKTAKEKLLVGSSAAGEWSKLKDALAGTQTESVENQLAISGNKITLLADFTATEGAGSLSVSDTKTLDLNGHVINGAELVGSVITVPANANLTLTDNSEDKTHKFTVGENGLWTLDETKGTKTVTGGVITGGKNDSGNGNGGGVSNSGNFTMFGGIITGNMAINGGGVYAAFNNDSKKSVILVGGTVTGNRAEKDGGGVYVKEEECFAAGTLITMEDGSRKPIETLEIGDPVRVFDHDTGTISTAKLFDLWKYPEKHSGAVTLHFSHDIDVTVVYGHSFFDREANKYVSVSRDNVDSYVGHEFYNVDDECWETLDDYDLLDGEVDTYVITSEKHLNCVANGMLSNEDGIYTTLTNVFEYGDGLKIDAEKKADDLEKYGLFGYEEQQYVSKETYDILNLQYLNVAFGKGMITKDVVLSLGTYWSEVDPEFLCGTTAQPCIDEAGETYFETSSESVQNDKPKMLSAAGMPEPGDITHGVYLGGTIKIIDNTAKTSEDTTANNLYLPGGKTITLGTGTGEGGNGVAVPTEEMSIGVTTQNAPASSQRVDITGKNAADYHSCFCSDNTNYAVVNGGSGEDQVVQLCEHEHSWKYESKDNQITATCTDTVGGTCGYKTTPLTLTLTAPGSAALVYDGTAKSVDYADGEADAWRNVIGSSAPAIKYYEVKDTTEIPLESAPIKAGSYVAKAAVGSGESAKTAKLQFAISKKQLTVTMGEVIEKVPYDGLVTKPADPVREGFAFGGWYTEEACITAWNFAVDTVKDNMTLYPKWIKNEEKKAVIGGNVTEDGVKVPQATVELFLGTEKIAAAVTDNDGNYKFDNVKLGTYNIVVTKEGGSKTKTELVTVDRTGEFSADVKLPKGNVNSKVEHKEGDTIPEAKSDISKTVVGGLDEIAEEQTPAGSDRITIKLTVEPKKDEATPAQQKIKKEAGEGKKVEFLDLSLLKQVNGGDEEDIGDKNNKLLTIVIPFNFEGVNVTGMMILRNHGGNTSKLTETPNRDGEYFTPNRSEGTLTIRAKKFSDYAIAYSEVTTPDPSDDESDERNITAYAEPVANATAITGSWQYKEAEDTWYYIVDGSSLKNGWYYLANPYSKTVKTGWFCFDEAGKMQRGWILSKLGHWFFTHDIKDGDLGRLETGWHKDDQDGLSYYLDLQTGSMYTGWHVIDGVTYYFTETSVKTTWKRDEKGRWVATAAIGKPLGSLDPTAKK